MVSVNACCDQACFEIGEAAFRFTPRAKHRLQGLGLLIDFEFDEIHRAFERDALGFQINLPCDAGAREIFAVFRNCETDLFGQAGGFGVQLLAPPLEAEFLGARFAERDSALRRRRRRFRGSPV